jgi:RNA polymerase sigma-70 factor (ECF subfamily)
MSPSDWRRQKEDLSRRDSGQTRFRVLYDETIPRVYRYVTRAVAPNLVDLDDLVAEVYLVAWRRIDELPPPPEDQLWLLGVARNVVAHHRRSTALRSRLQDRLFRERPTLEPDVDVSDGVLNAVRHLPQREREAFHLVVWEGLRIEEAATVIGCSPNAVRIRVHRARRRLADRLSTKGPITDRDLSTSVLNWELP